MRDVVGELRVVLRVGAVEEKEDEVEATEKRRREVDVLRHRLSRIVPPV